MGIRLNKVLTELNIGLQTAVDFLKKKNHLGEIRDDATSNTKISDEQYQALFNEFKGDKDVKTLASTLFPKKKEKKPEVAKTKTEEEMAQRQQFKPLGKIDLDNIGKPKSAATATKEATEPEKKAEPKQQPLPAAESTAVKEAKALESVDVPEEKPAEPVQQQEPAVQQSVKAEP